MLSESMHSLADLGNQVLLAVGLQQSLRRADKTRPYGYGFEQYVWAMISGVRLATLRTGRTSGRPMRLRSHRTHPEDPSPTSVGEPRITRTAGLRSAPSTSCAHGSARAPGISRPKPDPTVLDSFSAALR
jgi:hypothetical protein